MAASEAAEEVPPSEDLPEEVPSVKEETSEADSTVEAVTTVVTLPEASNPAHQVQAQDTTQAHKVHHQVWEEHHPTPLATATLHVLTTIPTRALPLSAADTRLLCIICLCTCAKSEIVFSIVTPTQNDLAGLSKTQDYHNVKSEKQNTSDHKATRMRLGKTKRRGGVSRIIAERLSSQRLLLLLGPCSLLLLDRVLLLLLLLHGLSIRLLRSLLLVHLYLLMLWIVHARRAATLLLLVVVLLVCLKVCLMVLLFRASLIVASIVHHA